VIVVFVVRGCSGVGSMWREVGVEGESENVETEVVEGVRVLVVLELKFVSTEVSRFRMCRTEEERFGVAC
jgi:hypothetical protein